LRFHLKSERGTFTHIDVGIAISVGVAGAKSAPERAIRISFQKYGNPVVLKRRGGPDERLAPFGSKVEWKELP
jgi:sulfonate transport system substrate-binding protein